MKELDELKLEQVSAGDGVTAFCSGFSMGVGVYVLGTATNFWNPVGWGAGVAIAVIGVGCAVYWKIMR